MAWKQRLSLVHQVLDAVWREKSSKTNSKQRHESERQTHGRAPDIKGSKSQGSVSSRNSLQKLIIKTRKGIFLSPFTHFSFQNFWTITLMMTLPVPRGLWKIPMGCLHGKGNIEGQRPASLPGMGPDCISETDISSIYAAGFSLDFIGTWDCSHDVKWGRVTLWLFSPFITAVPIHKCLRWASLPYLGLSHSTKGLQPAGHTFPLNWTLYRVLSLLLIYFVSLSLG